MIKSSLLVFIFLCSAGYVHGQMDASKIDKTDLKRFVKVLSADSLEGRGTGTVGEKKAARFISTRFAELGLRPCAKNGFFETFNLTETYWGQVYLKTSDAVLRNFERI